MLKPADPPTGSGRPIGNIVGQLVDDGKAYANAEIDVAKAIAAEKGRALVPPAILLGSAILVALAGITALAVGVVMALAGFVGPLLAGLAGLLIFGGLAGLLGWIGINQLKAIL